MDAHLTKDSLTQIVARAMAVALKADCTTTRGECYAHGFTGQCPQEGGWPGEVDGEFDLEELAIAAISAAREAIRAEAFEEAANRIGQLRAELHAERSGEVRQVVMEALEIAEDAIRSISRPATEQGGG